MIPLRKTCLTSPMLDRENKALKWMMMMMMMTIMMMMMIKPCYMLHTVLSSAETIAASQNILKPYWVTFLTLFSLFV